MGETLHRLLLRKEVLARLTDLMARSDSTLLIHYSCESFYDRTDGATPRVTSIAVRNLGSAQTESFSIHKVAELQGIARQQIGTNYDHLERAMLDEFFAFLAKHERCIWVHWNMRDINYGFQAIEHRYRVLGGKPTYLPPEERKFDLARAMVAIYGPNYARHPRLQSLTRINAMTDIGFLAGEDEAAAFESQDYVRLHQSTLRKVDILANVLERTLNKSLQTDAKWHEARGFHPRALLELITEHWLWALLTVVATILGVIALLK